MVRKIMNYLLGAFLLSLVLYLSIFWLLRNPVSVSYPDERNELAEAANLEIHVKYLTALKPSRNAQNVAVLDEAAGYIKQQFSETGCELSEQKFTVNGNEYKNVICSFGPKSASRVVIGAHYDVHGENNPGADDNASGVAAILEIARLIEANQPELDHRLDLVAFTLEELPHFRTEDMGSHIHAKSLVETKTDVKLMISVEMIGCFSDNQGSQDYPLNLLKLFYPDRGNFIGVIGLLFERSLVARVKKLMTVDRTLPVYSINAPGFIPGIDLSDHRNYWDVDLPALMITDTAFHRNKNYHQPTDTAETLDYRRMAFVVDGLYRVAADY